MGNSQEALTKLTTQVQNEQDELTLQKNYLTEVGRMLSSDTLKSSFDALITCMKDYPAYLFKKEKEFMYFVTKLNTLLDGVKTEPWTDYSQAQLELEIKEHHYLMAFYYTMSGACEITFEYGHKDMAVRMTLDPIKKQLSIVTEDLLKLDVISSAKSVLIHYLVDVMEEIRTLDFEIETKSMTNIDPFKMFTRFVYDKTPRLEDRDYDRLFIEMDGIGDMRYTSSKDGVVLTLANHHRVTVVTPLESTTSRITLENTEHKIYLFDLLAENPFLEMLFDGEVIVRQKPKKEDKKA